MFSTNAIFSHSKKSTSIKFIILRSFKEFADNFEIYGDFKISNERGMRSNKAIPFIFDKNMFFIIIHRPMKFDLN